jgi:hypothetical protein
MKQQFFFLLPLLVSCWTVVSGLAPVASAKKQESESGSGSGSESEKVEVYKIVGVPAGGTQYLPASYVKTFSRWQIDSSGQIIAVSSEECALDKESATTISIQPTINFLLENGVPSYLFVGLQVEEGKDKQSNHIAQQWTTFDTAAEANFRVEIFMGQEDRIDVQRLGVVDAKRMNQAVEQLGKSLAMSGLEDLASGFRIIEIPLKMEMKGLDMARSKGGTMMVTCLATSEPDASRLLRLEESELEKTATSKLEVDAWKVLKTALK